MRRRPLPSLDEDLADEPFVNLTPLIDVVFVVLIAFLLVAPVLDLDSVLLASSGQTSKKEKSTVPSDSFSISIRADNSIWFQGRQVDLQNLETALSLEKQRRPLETPRLIPDARSHFETYQRVKNVLEACGFEQMEILLRPP